MSDKLAEKLKQAVSDALQYKWIDFFECGMDQCGNRSLHVDAERVERDRVYYVVSAILLKDGNPVNRTGGAWSGDWSEYSDKPERMIEDAVADFNKSFWHRVFFTTWDDKSQKWVPN